MVLPDYKGIENYDAHAKVNVMRSVQVIKMNCLDRWKEFDQKIDQKIELS